MILKVNIYSKTETMIKIEDDELRNVLLYV